MMQRRAGEGTPTERRLRLVAGKGVRRRRRPPAMEQFERRLALAIVTPFTVRYTTNDTGDIAFAANTLMTAGPPATPTEIADAQNGVGPNLDNNDFTMTYVDVDSDATTWNSSSSALLVPAGSQVLFAGLYWGARTNSTFPTGLSSERPLVKFKAPGDTAYRDLTGRVIGTTGNSYQSFANVTSIVRAAGGGVYTTANVRAVTDASDFYAGWSLVVAYRAPGAPVRNLTVFDGYGDVRDKDPAITINVSGFKTPTSGPVNATIGFVAYEGDLGYDGDNVTLDGGKKDSRGRPIVTTLRDATNPANNFFNSTISNRGSLVSTKSPNYVNQLGFDANLISADNLIANGATSALITMKTGGETYYPGVVTTAIDLYAPQVTVAKQVQDLDGGQVLAGDVLRYTLTVGNDSKALDSAINVLLQDAIPAGTTYKPGSLVVSSGANAGAKTDAADGDQAEFLAGTTAVQFRLGSGAAGAGTSGGSLAAGQSTTLTFDVTVNAGLPPATLIDNLATVTFTGATSGLNLTAIDTATIATPGAADLAVTKTDGRTQYVPGTTTTYTIVVANNGPTAVTGARVVDIMPASLANVSWTATYGAGGSGPSSGSGSIDALVDLPVGGTATFVVNALIRPEAFGDITNTVAVTPPAGVPDSDESNNVATDTNSFLHAAGLVLDKVVQDVNGGVLQAGDVLRYTMIVRSTTPGVDTASQEATANVILTDVVPTNTTFKPGSLRVLYGPNSGAKTDAIDADQGEYIGGTNTVQFQLGTGAGAGTGTPVGGTLPAGTYTEVTFEVTVDAGIPDSTLITNTATVTGTGATSGLLVSATDTIGIATAPAADLFVQKRATSTFAPGATITYIVTAGNKGPSAVTGATVVDVLPAGLSNATWTARYSGGAAGPTSGSGSITTQVDLPSLGAAVFNVTATVDADFSLDQILTNTATITGPAGIPDPNPDDNTSTVTSTPEAVTDLAVTKTDGQTQYVPGQTVTYTITVTNNGPSFAPLPAVSDTLNPAVFDVTAATWTASYAGPAGFDGGAGWTGSSGSGTGSLSEILNVLPSGGTVTYVVAAPTLPTATGSLVNTVTVSTSDLSNDPNPSNNSATDTDSVTLPADLLVDKTVIDVNGGFVVSGDTLRYTIVVTNPAAPAGGTRDTAISVALSDVIPANTTYAGNLTFTQGAVTGSQGGGVAGTLGTLAPGASATITFDVTVNPGTPDATPIINNAFLTGTGQLSGQLLEGAAGVAVITPPGADLRIVKSATPASTYVPGRPLTYTFVVSNLGPSTATGARVQDTLPAGLTGGTWTATYAGGASGAASGTGSIDTLVAVPVGGTATFRVTATAAATLTAPIINTATVQPPDGLVDPDLGNNTSSVTNTATPTADLQITKTDGRSSYVPGAPVIYTITVTNAGPSFVTNALVNDPFDPSIIVNATWTAVFTGAGSTGATSGSGSLVNRRISLAPGGTAVYTVTAQTSSAATATLVNTATVTAPAGTTDPTPSNNQAADVDTMLPPAKLVVTKGVQDLNGGFVVAGDTLRYTITVANNPGVSQAEFARDVILSDVIPANTTYKPGTLRITGGANAGAKTDAVDADQGEYGAYFNTVYFQLGNGAGAGTGVPQGGTLQGGQSTTVTFDVTVNAGIPLSTLITNTALATATAAVSGTPLQATGTVGITTAAGADLAIVKTGPATFVPGSPLTYTLVVTNTGPGTSTNALVQDSLPAGLTGGSWTAVYAGGATGPASGGPGGVNANVTLPSAGRATFTITAQATSTLRGTVANTATVTPTDADPDPNPSNNTSTSTGTATPVADLAIVKTDGSATYVPGQPVIYTITVSNNGPSFVSGATVSDVFPAATVAAASWTAVFTGAGSTGTSSGNGSLNELIDLAAGGTAVYTVTCLTRPSATTSLVNTASVTVPSGTTDPTPGNNSSTDTNTVILPARLAVTKTVEDLDGGAVDPGDYLRYTIVVANNVGSPPPVESAANVILTDAIPAGALYVTSGFPGVTSPTTTRGTVTGDPTAGVTAAIGTLAGGESATIVFYVQVDPAVPSSTIVTNTAVASGTGATTGQPLTGSDSVGVVTPDGADLVIEKTGPATFTPGESLTYQFVVTNLGPSTANGAQVTDSLPAGLSAVTWSVAYAGGAAGPAGGSGDVDALIDIPVGGTATFTVSATADSTTLDELANTAFVTGPDGVPDPNLDDNASTTISTPVADTAMTIVKTDGSASYTPGSPVVYTITVTNAGPSFAQGALVRDILDPSIIASARWTATFTGDFSVGNTVGTGSIDEVIDLAVGGTAVYTVVARTLSGATADLVNTAELVAPDGSTSSSTDIDKVNFVPGLIVSPDAGCDSEPLVEVLDPLTGLPRVRFLAYEPGFRGGVQTFAYDVTGDGVAEILTAPGRGRPGEVRVFSQTGVELPAYRFFPYGPAFTGGVQVAGGAMTGLGLTQLVTGQLSGGNLVRVFDVTPGATPVNSTPIRQFRPFGATYTGGVRVTTADVGTFSGPTGLATTRDGILEIISGTGPGIRATVAVHNAVPATPVRVGSFNPISPSYTNGVAVARLPGTGTAGDRLLVSGSLGSNATVETWRYAVVKQQFVKQAAFAAYDANAAVYAAALSESELFTVEGLGGKTSGVKKFAGVKGTGSSTISGSTSIAPPQRITAIWR